MKFICLRATLFSVGVVICNFANAGIIGYDFAFQASGESILTGSFSAEDLNNDNFIRDGELVSLSFSNDIYSVESYSSSSATWDSLNFNFDIGATVFSLGGDSYTDSGQSWNFSGVGIGFGAGSGCAGFSFDGAFQGCAFMMWSEYDQAVVETSLPVPTPSALAIFALGFMALAARRFKKQS